MEMTSLSRTGRCAASGNRVSRWEVRFLINQSGGEVMTIVYVGIDLTKNVFAVHGVELDRGRRVAPVPRRKAACADCNAATWVIDAR